MNIGESATSPIKKCSILIHRETREQIWASKVQLLTRRAEAEILRYRELGI